MFDHLFSLIRSRARRSVCSTARRPLQVEILEPRAMLAGGNIDITLANLFARSRVKPLDPAETKLPTFAATVPLRESITLVRSPAGHETSDTGPSAPLREPITLEGTVPRRVRILDRTTLETVFDQWHHREELDISFLPDGRYDLSHAASGQPWETAELVAGVQLPSRRLLVRNVDENTLEFDWGRLGSYPAFQVEVTQGQNKLFDAWHYHPVLQWQVSQGPVNLRIAAPSHDFQSFSFREAAPVVPNITLHGTLPRRVQIVDAFTSELLFDDWHYRSTFEIAQLPKGRYNVSHAASGETWVAGQLYTDTRLPSGRVFLQRVGNELDMDWGELGNHPAFYVNVLEDGAPQFSAWHYRPTLRIPTGPNATVQIAPPSQNFEVFHFGTSMIYDVPPIPFETRLVLPVGMPARSDLRSFGQYQFVAMEKFASALRCEYQAGTAAHQIVCDGKTVEWRVGRKSITSPTDAHPVELPAAPLLEDGVLFFPIRILAEKFGFNTRFDPATNVVTVFRLASALRTVPLELDHTISGSDLNFTYFNTAHETLNQVYLTFDQSNSIVRFEKPDFTYTLLTAPAEYGHLGEFVVNSAGEIYVASAKGHLLKWANGEFSVVGGAGSERLSSFGSQTTLSNLKAYKIDELVLRDDRTLFFYGDGYLYRADLVEGTVTLLWRGDVRDLDVYRGEPLIVREPNGILWLNSADQTAQGSECFNQLFRTDDSIHGARYLPSVDRFVVISASRRLVYEVQMSFDNEPGERPCRFLRETYAGDNVAYLTAIGTSDPAITAAGQLLLVDADGFNLAHYALGGDLTLITKQQLGAHANTTFVGPVSVAEQAGNLYIVANSSHQVMRYSLLDKTLERFVGNGIASRNESTDVPRLDISLGYPSEIRVVGDRLWIADHFYRRILVVEGDTVRQLFWPTEWSFINGIVGFDIRGNELYFVDQASGGIYRWRMGDPQPVHYAGYVNPAWITGSTLVRRGEASRSTEEMTTIATVSFGLPQSVAVLGDGRIVVSDLYRSGLWGLSADGSVQRLAGLNADTEYHYGAFTGNAGLESDELRIGTPTMLTYDPPSRILLVGGGFSGTVAFIRDDFAKTCLATLDFPLEYVSQARFLSDGRLAVVDPPRNAVHIFKPPDLSCLNSRIDR